MATPKDNYGDAISRLTQYFEGASSILLHRKDFFEAKQKSHESCNEFAVRLRRLFNDCGFSSSQTELLRDIFVIGIFQDRLAEQLLALDSSKLTFESALQKAEAFERACHERRSYEVAAVSKTPATKTDAGKRCYRCGNPDHMADSINCRARNSTCHKCQKKGHFKSQCRSSKTSPEEQIATSQHRRKTVSHVTDNTSSPSSLFSVTHTVHSISEMKRTIILDGKPTEAIIDTGAAVNVLPSSVLTPQSELSPSSVKLSAWGCHPLQVLGELRCHVQYKDVSVEDNFVVVSDDSFSPPLLSPSLCRKLNMLSEIVSHVPEIYDKYPSVFEGNGTLKNFQCKLYLQDNAVPSSVPSRCLPLSLHEAVKKELDSMVANDIICEVTEPTP